jgi:hypothetical protein
MNNGVQTCGKCHLPECHWCFPPLQENEDGCPACRYHDAIETLAGRRGNLVKGVYVAGGARGQKSGR